MTRNYTISLCKLVVSNIEKGFAKQGNYPHKCLTFKTSATQIYTLVMYLILLRRILGSTMTDKKIDWELLRSEAKKAQKNAYANYSKFPVGAAALVDDGRIVSGCNVENASYGLTLCAECGLVSQLALTGGGRLVAFSCVGPEPGILLPCGRCRQLLQEHGGGDLIIDHNDGPKKLKELLPDAFDGSHLK